MSFIGSINDKLRKFFYTHADKLEGKKCYIGCSGNFTVEQILSRRCSNVEIYSNDVSLYSSAVGHMVTERPFDFGIQFTLDAGGNPAGYANAGLDYVKLTVNYSYSATAKWQMRPKGVGAPWADLANVTIPGGSSGTAFRSQFIYEPTPTQKVPFEARFLVNKHANSNAVTCVFNPASLWIEMIGGY